MLVKCEVVEVGARQGVDQLPEVGAMPRLFLLEEQHLAQRNLESRLSVLNIQWLALAMDATR